jgi:hypothetical protein
MSNRSAEAERAARLIETLRRQREQGTGYPLTVAALRDLADPQVNDADLLAALAKRPYAGQVVLAAKKDLASPIALAEDAGELAKSSLLLEYALGKLASADKPLHAPAKVVGRVDKALRPAFAAAVEERLTSGTLPDAVGRHEVKGKLLLYLKHFPPPPPPAPKKSPAVALAEHLLKELIATYQRDEMMVALADLAGPDVKPALLKKAVATDPFHGEAFVVPVSKTLALVSLASQREALLGSDRLLVAVLETKTTAKKLFITLAALAEALSEDQRATFLSAQGRKIETGSLPGAVLVRMEAGQQVLCLRVNLPEKLLLKEQALVGLALRRERGDYPVSLEELLRTEAPGADRAAVARLAADKSFKSQVVQALPGNPSSPVVLPGDEQRLLSSPVLIEFALSTQSSADNQAVPAAELGKKLAAGLKRPFADALQRRLQEGTLPPSVGCLVIRKKPYLFLLAELSSKPVLPPAPPPRTQGADAPRSPERVEPAKPPIDFAAAFAQAFDKLDRERGAHGLVSLVWLRQEIPVGRAQFDEGLNALRRAGLYTLTAAESRSGITPEEREAGIFEQGSLLLYVSRREG